MSDTGVLQKVVGLKTKHDLSDAQFVNFFNRVQEEKCSFLIVAKATWQNLTTC